MKENIKFLILMNRSEQAAKLDKVKGQFKKKNSEAIEEIQDIRMKLAGKLMQAEKVGNAEHCLANVDEEKIDTYCARNFADSPFRLVDCKNPDKYCKTCCNNEYG